MCDKVNFLNKEIDRRIIKEINGTTETFLKTNHLIKKKVVSELESRIKTGYKTIISKKVAYYYQYIREDDEVYGKYFIIDGFGKKSILLDCEKLSKGYDFWNLTELEFSQDETFLVYSVDTLGDGLCSMYIKEYFSNDVYEINFEKNARVSGNFELSYDNKSIYYITCDKDNRRNKLIIYNIAEKTSKIIYKEDPRQYGLTVSKSGDGSKIILIASSYLSTEIYEVIGKDLTILFSRENNVFYSVDFYVNNWYVLKNNKGNCEISCYDDECFKKKIIFKDAGREIEDFYIACGYMFLFLIEKGLRIMYLMSLKTYKIVKTELLHDTYSITFPSLSNMNIMSPIVVMEFTNYIKPPCNFVINLNELGSSLSITEPKYYKPIHELNKYKEKCYGFHTFDVNKDGLRLTLIYNKDIMGKCRKCLLYGYGSYGISQEPYFSKSIPSLLDRGYYYCIAHIRGGGENGFKWYDDGRLLNKKNTFTDYIECAEFLINNGLTEPCKLVGMGASAGGLLMGTVINMRPELFNLVIMGVPFLNVLSEMCNDKKPLTTEEYYEWGNPKEKKYFEYIKSYCPYTNINLKNEYPNIYIYSNIEDSLVDYKVPYNYYLKIRESEVFKNKSRNIFLNIKLKYGHKGSSNHFEKNSETGDIYTVILSIN